MPVYQGRDSCMARREGKYVRRIEHPGIDTIDEAVALVAVILRDYRRRYTYDARCKKISMNWSLARKRLNYIAVLAKKHGASRRELETIKRLVAYAEKNKKLPRRVNGRDTRAILMKMIVKTK